MKVVVVTFHYPPDLGAGAFRMHALVDSLECSGQNVSVEVLTTKPHRYTTFRPEAPGLERIGKTTVQRFRLPGRTDSKGGLARAYFSFWRQCLRHVKVKRADAVVATASRLFPAMVGADLAKRLDARFYLDLRDLFALNFAQIHPQWWWKPIQSTLARWESAALKQADHISIVSPGFVRHLPSNLVSRGFSVNVNGVDKDFQSISAPGKGQSDGLLEVVYAGNIGQGQALERILPELAARLKGRARFTIYGEGRGRVVLERRLRERNLDNVRVMGPVPRSDLPAIYRTADVLFLHLAPQPAFSATIPSKLFEYCATGRPVWGGVFGVAAHLLESEVENAGVFQPGNVDEAIEALAGLQMCHTPRPEFVRKYARDSIARAMASEITLLGR